MTPAQQRAAFVWQEATMAEALRFAAGRTVDEEYRLPDGICPPDYACAVEGFTDGTAVACLSLWDGPCSSTTPDTSAEPPLWWIYAREDSAP